MNELVFVDNQNRVVTDSITVAREFDKNHADVMRDVRNLLMNTEQNWGISNFAETPYVHEQNHQTYSKFIMTEDGFAILAMGFTGSKAIDFKIRFLNEFKRMREQLTKPRSVEDLIIMQAQSVKELKERVEQVSTEVKTVNHRIDSLDATNIDGDLQQRFNAMIRKYAMQNGLTFPQAYRDFRQAYNTAFRTNLTMLLENFAMKKGVKHLSMPDYLNRSGKLEDAIRVADKMLNQKAVNG